MKTNDNQTDTENVEAFILTLEPTIRNIVQQIRLIILSADQSVCERIKWNHPSFYYSGEIKPFNPKEYKRDIAVFNLFKGRVMLVFPSGAKLDDKTGLLTGDFKDGRRILIYKDFASVQSSEENLKGLIRKWLSMVEK